MNVTINKKGKFLLVRLVGELNLFNAPEAQRQIVETPIQDCDSVIVDCGELSHVDSSGIGCLLQLRRKYQAENLKFFLAALPEGLHNMLKMSGLAAHLSIIERADVA